MPAEGPPGRINLAEPGRRPSRPRMRRILLIVLAVLTAGAAVTGVVVARRPIGAAATTAWQAVAGWATSLRDTAATVPESTTTTTTTIPAPPSRAVLVVVGATVGESAFALLIQDPARDPQLLLIPQSLLVQVPGYGEFSMAEALGFGGPALAELALANEMGLRIDDRVEVAAGGLEGVFPDLVVDVPVELYVTEADGSRRLIAAGTQRLAADLVELLLVEQGDGDLFDWLRRQEAVWTGILEAAAADQTVAGRLTAGAGDAAAAAGLLLRIAGEGSIEAPPLDRVALGGGRNAFVLATDRIAGYLAAELGHLLLGERPRPRVEILNGNGVAGSGIPIARTLVSEGFYVFRSGNADRFDYAASLVIAQGEANADAARAAATALGIGEVVMEANAPSGVVDVSIIVGTDLAPKEG